jgi:hypothetical protein
MWFLQLTAVLFIFYVIIDMCVLGEVFDEARREYPNWTNGDCLRHAFKIAAIFPWHYAKEWLNSNE